MYLFVERIFRLLSKTTLFVILFLISIAANGIHAKNSTCIKSENPVHLVENKSDVSNKRKAPTKAEKRQNRKRSKLHSKKWSKF